MNAISMLIGWSTLFRNVVCVMVLHTSRYQNLFWVFKVQGLKKTQFWRKSANFMISSNLSNSNSNPFVLSRLLSCIYFWRIIALCGILDTTNETKHTMFRNYALDCRSCLFVILGLWTNVIRDVSKRCIFESVCCV